MKQYNIFVSALKDGNYKLALAILNWIYCLEDMKSEQYKKFLPYLPALKSHSA